MTNNGKETKRESAAEMAIKIAQIASEGKLTEETELSKIIREKVRRKNEEKHYQSIAGDSCFADFEEIQEAFKLFKQEVGWNLGESID